MNDSPSTQAALQVTIPSDRGPIAALFHDCEPARGTVLTVAGLSGGFDGPANGLYGDLADALSQRNIALLRLDYRIKRTGPIDDGTSDVLAGIHWLQQRDRGPVLLVGHSYGGAIVVRAGLRSSAVAGVAALATQTAGIEDVAQLSPRSLLLIHGLADDRLPPGLSHAVHARAREPKSLHLLEGVGHSLREQPDAVRSLLLNWCDETLPALEPPPPSTGGMTEGTASPAPPT